jgi:mannosyltransferase
VSGVPKWLTWAGVAAILLAIALPPAWYDPLPQREVLPPPPFSGMLLLRIAIALQGALLLWFGLRRWRFVPTEARDCVQFHPAPEAEDRTPRVVWWVLGGITLLGLVLRLIAIDSDLWLDELSPILDYRDASVWQVFISYISSNNHLLYTVLEKLSVLLFGEREWALRLPAVIFGTAAIPVLYWVARKLMPRYASLGAALLLAVSYHHILFSQNARGYTAYVLFSLLSTGLLVDGLERDRSRTWALYIASMAMNFASVLISGFVFLSHLLVGGGALWEVARRGGPPMPLLRRLVGVFVITGSLGFLLYAAVLPQVYVYTRVVYADLSTGFSPFSREFVAEIARGLSAGFGPGLLLGALPFLAIGGIGYAVLLRRNWALILALTFPGIIQAALLAIRGLALSPRFFILALPLAILVAAEGVVVVAEFAARLLRRDSSFAVRTAFVLTMGVAVGSMSALPRYYAIPKQAYRSSIEYVERVRQPDDLVIVIHIAESGYRYYGERYHLREGQDYFYVRSVAALDDVLAQNPGRRAWLVTTFPRALRLSLPDLDARIRRDWVVAREFPATIGDGALTVWQQARS